MPVRLFNDGKLYAPTASSALLGALHGVVSGLMHLLILSAARGTPGLGLASQDKFSELARDLYPAEAVPRHVVANFTVRGGLSAAMLRFTDNLDSSREHLRRKLPLVRALAHRNLDVFALDEPSGPDRSVRHPLNGDDYQEFECCTQIRRRHVYSRIGGNRRVQLERHWCVKEFCDYWRHDHQWWCLRVYENDLSFWSCR